jgi:ribonuclease HI
VCNEAIGVHSNNVAELWVIWLAIYTIKKRKIKKDMNIIETINFFTDSEYVFNTFTARNNPRKHMELITWICNEITILRRQNYEIKWFWIPGHVNIQQNEMVDKSAKEAAEESKSNPIPFNIEHKPENLPEIRNKSIIEKPMMRKIVHNFDRQIITTMLNDTIMDREKDSKLNNVTEFIEIQTYFTQKHMLKDIWELIDRTNWVAQVARIIFYKIKKPFRTFKFKI